MRWGGNLHTSGAPDVCDTQPVDRRLLLGIGAVLALLAGAGVLWALDTGPATEAIGSTTITAFGTTPTTHRAGSATSVPTTTTPARETTTSPAAPSTTTSTPPGFAHRVSHVTEVDLSASCWAPQGEADR